MLPSISDLTARASPHTSAFNPCLTIDRIARISPEDTIGNPASIVSTPNSSNLIAICNFCSELTETPGVCSPSLKVVSKILICSAISRMISEDV